MICHLCERALFMHAHGELGGVARFLLQCHLEGCDACRACWAKAVVEKDHLRRALSPMPTLDPEGERRLQIIGARIRMEQRPSMGSPPAVAPTPAPVAPLRAWSGRRTAGLALAAGLLAITLTAMAAAWGPSLAGAVGLASPSPKGSCLPEAHCPSCLAKGADASGAAKPGAAPGAGPATVGNSPAVDTHPPSGTGATAGAPAAPLPLPGPAGAPCPFHPPAGTPGTPPGAAGQPAPSAAPR